jgi:excisionase family DNA binding protein
MSPATATATAQPTEHPTPTDPLLTTQDVAVYLQVSMRFVAKEQASGRLRPVKVGRCVRFRASEVERYLEAQQP